MITDGIECRRLKMSVLFVYARTILFRLQVKTLKCLTWTFCPIDIKGEHLLRD